MDHASAYQADRTLRGKIRRRLVRLAATRPLANGPERAMVSFSFDDAPQTAVVSGAQALETRGARGTYFVSAGLCGAEAPMGVCGRADDYQRLSQAGHEIACHTYSHLDCGRADSGEAFADVERNAMVMSGWGVPAPKTFAYPYGDVAVGPKAALGGRFSVLRALHHGLIEAGCDLNQAPAVGIEGPDGEILANRWIDLAVSRSAWLILYTHDVRTAPSVWGCAQDVLARLIDRAQDSGADVVTVGEGARRLGL